MNSHNISNILLLQLKPPSIGMCVANVVEADRLVSPTLYKYRQTDFVF